jgi:hypothetical protein
LTIKRSMTLAAPITRDAFSSLTGFSLDYLYINDSHVSAYLQPSGVGPVAIYPAGAEGVTPGKGVILLTPTQTLKLTNFITAIEEACKNNLEGA